MAIVNNIYKEVFCACSFCFYYLLFFLLKKKEGKSYIREYIMKMSNLTLKLKTLKIELGEELLVHLVLISLIVHFGQFKVSYNTQKNKWSINEVISHCVQEEKRL